MASVECTRDAESILIRIKGIVANNQNAFNSSQERREVLQQEIIKLAEPCFQKAETLKQLEELSIWLRRAGLTMDSVNISVDNFDEKYANIKEQEDAALAKAQQEARELEEQTTVLVDHCSQWPEKAELENAQPQQAIAEDETIDISLLRIVFKSILQFLKVIGFIISAIAIKLVYSELAYNDKEVFFWGVIAILLVAFLADYNLPENRQQRAFARANKKANKPASKKKRKKLRKKDKPKKVGNSFLQKIKGIRIPKAKMSLKFTLSVIFAVGLGAISFYLYKNDVLKMFAYIVVLVFAVSSILILVIYGAYRGVKALKNKKKEKTEAKTEDKSNKSDKAGTSRWQKVKSTISQSSLRSKINPKYVLAVLGGCGAVLRIKKNKGKKKATPKGKVEPSVNNPLDNVQPLSQEQRDAGRAKWDNNSNTESSEEDIPEVLESLKVSHEVTPTEKGSADEDLADEGSAEGILTHARVVDDIVPVDPNDNTLKNKKFSLKLNDSEFEKFEALSESDKNIFEALQLKYSGTTRLELVKLIKQVKNNPSTLSVDEITEEIERINEMPESNPGFPLSFKVVFVSEKVFEKYQEKGDFSLICSEGLFKGGNSPFKDE